MSIPKGYCVGPLPPSSCLVPPQVFTEDSFGSQRPCGLQSLGKMRVVTKSDWFGFQLILLGSDLISSPLSEDVHPK
jgi:hypothetical protein